MKKFFTLLLCMAASMATFAQIDASSWKAGDDVSEAVGFGNLSFENDPMDYWTFESSKGSTTTTGGLFECYDGADCDLYQYIQVPAGMYYLECQGYYRYGTSWDADPNSYANGTWQNLSSLYVSTGTYDIESAAFTESGTTFSSPLMPRLFDTQESQIYVMPEGASSWDMSDGNYTQVSPATWGPTSVPGSLAWFAADKYLPFEDEANEIIYNRVIFYVTETTWIKVGVKKTDSRSADSFMATNFHLYYEGDAGEAAQKDLALKSYSAIHQKVDNYAEEIMATYGALGAMLQDASMMFEGDLDTVEGIEAATDSLKKMMEDYQTYYKQAQALTAAISSAEELANSTDYSGKAALLEAIEAAKAVEQDGNGDKESTLTDPAEYGKAAETLDKARVAYIQTQDIEGDKVDYSDVINNSFFTDNAYVAKWNEEKQQYTFSDEIESTWCTIQEQSYTEALAANSEWIPISSNVTIATSGDDEGHWVINSTTWHGGGAIGVTMQHSYPAIGGWTESPSGNAELLHQTVTGLPNGFYSMGALMCNAGGDISDLMYVYIQNSNGDTEKAPLTVKGSPWWGGSVDQWRSGVWEKLNTGMVNVTDGKVTIGSSSDCFYAVTGFRLYYYGENPDFSAMVSTKLEAVKAEASEKLSFPGDITKVNDILAEIKIPVTGFDAYTAANEAIAEAEDYISAAYSYLNSWNLVEDVLAEQAKYDPETEATEYAIYDQSFNHAFTVGTGENDTYEDAQVATADFNALKTYMSYSKTAVENYGTYNADLASLVASQYTELSTAYADAAKIAEFTAAVEAAVKTGATNKNAQILAGLGIDKATEANPVDVSVLLKNASFDEGKTGWNDANNNLVVDSKLHNAERWNANFDYSQTIESLPAGCYKLEVQAFYRDGSISGTESGSYYNWYLAAAADMDLWENKNVELYEKTNTNERFVNVKSICSELFTEPSYDSYVSDSIEGDIKTDEQGNVMYDEQGNEIVEYDYIYTYLDTEDPAYPFDSKVVDGDNTYWFPNSMTGANFRYNKSPESYHNEVGIMVNEGEDLTIGIRKSTTISNDWCLFDNFKLYYLGTAVPDAINATKAATSTTSAIYSVNGARQQTMQRGINIVRMSDGTVKKVLVK